MYRINLVHVFVKKKDFCFVYKEGFTMYRKNVCMWIIFNINCDWYLCGNQLIAYFFFFFEPNDKMI